MNQKGSGCLWLFVLIQVNSCCLPGKYAPASQIIILYILIYDKAGLSYYLAALYVSVK